ncbi:MAG: hypothetical protein AAB660_01205 [Patescibacteria group bacterium]
MSQSISHIFGGEAKVKIMRLFVFNRGSIYTAKTVAEKVQANPKIVRKELTSLCKAGLVHKRARGYVLNSDYQYLSATEHFLMEASAVTEKEIVKRLSKAGNMRLILTSGVFKHDPDPEARVDLLIVADKLKESRLVRAISALEAELGRELRYAAFETPDFKYRLGIYDKLIRDILDYPHRKLVDKVGL